MLAPLDGEVPLAQRILDTLSNTLQNMNTKEVNVEYPTLPRKFDDHLSRLTLHAGNTTFQYADDNYNRYNKTLKKELL